MPTPCPSSVAARSSVASTISSSTLETTVLIRFQNKPGNSPNSLSYIRGKASLKFGAQILRRQVNLFRPFAGKGYFFLFGNGGGDSPTGYEVSDVLAGLGEPVFRWSSSRLFSHTRNWETGYFVQDDWKINRKLTLNLGLRYDLYTWPEEENNLQANFDVPTGQLVLPGQLGYPSSPN